MTTAKKKIIRRSTVVPLLPRGLRPASEVVERPVSWLWEGYLPTGMVLGLIGDGGLGKSLFTLDIAARVSAGLPMPDGSPGVEGRALILSNEDTDTVVKKRLEAAGADLTRVILTTEDDEPWEFPRDAARLERAITQQDIRFVALDPVKDYMPTARDRDEKSVRDAIRPLKRVAENTGATILIVRHINKGQGTAGLRGAGSVAWRNVVRVEYAVAVDPDDSTRCLLACNKFNVTTKPATRAYRVQGVETMVAVLDWQGVSPVTADELFSPTRVTRPRDDAATFLRTVLAHGPRPAAQVREDAAALGIAERTLKRARKELGVKAVQTEAGWVLSLPHEGHAGRV